jgi:YD repeat-containing protein
MKKRAILFAALAIVGGSPAVAQEQVRIEYDALGRLTKVTHESGPNSGTQSAYTYDPASNRTNVTVTGVQKKVVVVPLNGFTIIPIN